MNFFASPHPAPPRESRQRCKLAACISLALIIVGGPQMLSGAEAAEKLLNQAQAARLAGDSDKALELANQAVKEQPRNPQCYYVRGRLHAGNNDPKKAVADFDEALKLEPRGAELYGLRGAEHFKLGQFKQSVADFDKFVEIVPAQEPHQWQRGISCYYAGDFEKGRKQFELHQTVNPNDVENAVWHYLCLAKLEGTNSARKSFIAIRGDGRVPMKQIHALFAGEGTAAQVLAAVGEGNPGVGEKNQRNFYAHLYLGLFYVATDHEALGKDHLAKAAEVYPVKHYMGDVARVHTRLLRGP